MQGAMSRSPEKKPLAVGIATKTQSEKLSMAKQVYMIFNVRELSSMASLAVQMAKEAKGKV